MSSFIMFNNICLYMSCLASLDSGGGGDQGGANGQGLGQGAG